MYTYVCLFQSVCWHMRWSQSVVTHTYTTISFTKRGYCTRQWRAGGDAVTFSHQTTDTAASGTSFVLALPAATATTVFVGLLLAALKTPTHIHTHINREAHTRELRERDSTMREHNVRKQLRTLLPHTRTQQ